MLTDEANELPEEFLLCSDCFNDQGLKLDAERIGRQQAGTCPNCCSNDGQKLSMDLLNRLTYRFFVRGSMLRTNYGGAPRLQYNSQAKTTICPPTWLEADLLLLENTIQAAIFHYGPRLWMIGEIAPLKKLQDLSERDATIERIIGEYPAITIGAKEHFYRVRKGPLHPEATEEYDSPPDGTPRSGRIDSPALNVMYASPDIETCIHECRVTAEDDLYIATLSASKELKLLDLTHHLIEPDNITEFESLDLSVNMLFLAGAHSYDIIRRLAVFASKAGFDGLNYPSYFSLLRTGEIPFETQYGLSNRWVATRLPHPGIAAHEAKKVIPNFALFGRPIFDGKVTVKCINRFVMRRIAYDGYFGPVGYS